MESFPLIIGIVTFVWLTFLFLMILGRRLFPAQAWVICRRIILGGLLLYPAGLLVLMVVQWVLPQDDGIFGVLQVFAPYLFIPLIFILPFACFHGTRWVRIMLTICLAVFILRFGDLTLGASNSATLGHTQLTVLNWNVGLGTEYSQVDRVRQVLVERPADIVVLAEAYWRWIESDLKITSLYPYRTALYWNAETGLVVLSAYPILAHDVPQQQNMVRGNPRRIVMSLDIGGEIVTLIAAHLPSPVVRFGSCTVLCYDVSERNKQLWQLRTIMRPIIQAKTPLLLVGDFNITSREPSYSTLIEGMRETHHEVGTGTGSTWPLPSLSVPSTGLINAMLPLIRIDHQFISDRIQPLESRVDCTVRGSDHCLSWGRFAILPSSP